MAPVVDAYQAMRGVSFLVAATFESHELKDGMGAPLAVELRTNCSIIRTVLGMNDGGLVGPE
jgi:hypothetical protein